MTREYFTRTSNIDLNASIPMKTKYQSPAAFLCTLKRVRVTLRNNKVLEGILKMYDKHFNMILDLGKEREVFIRGDSVITLARDG